MIKKIFTVIAVVVLGILGFAMTKPDTFRVERSAAVNAAPERIYPLIADFRRWTEWSPWENVDPNMKRSYEGATMGEGAVYAWEGNNKVGSGRMQIVEVSSPTRVVIKLDFIKPFEGHNQAEFMLKPEGKTTQVIWAMRGPNNLLSKVMSVFYSMDKMIGGMFEQGLASMKTAAEK